ncbi:MAG: choline TMA-lyase-activating enzyme [Cellulosilyticaceae bacterium]
MESGLDKKGKIFNIQKFSIYDGMGIRTLVFLKGCPLRCKWCSNPEGLSAKYQIMYLADKCVSCGKCQEVCPTGIHKMSTNQDGQLVHTVDRTIDCINCGKCEAVCHQEAVRVVGKEVTVREVLDVIVQDKDFYWSSGGGVTIGGGEMTMQGEFAAEILKQCKKQAIHTAVETCGHTNWSTYELLAPYTDLFLYDIKHIDTDLHKQLVGVNNDKILSNLENLFKIGANVVVRMPLIKGYNDSIEALVGAMEFIKRVSAGHNLKGIEILPYHKLGITKYTQLDMQYGIENDPGYTPEELEKLNKFISQFDLPIKVIKH